MNMFMYYLKIAIRNILTNRKFSIINIAGFAFALSICMAILLFLLKEHSYDSFHEYSNQIVRIVNTEYNSSLIDYRVKDILLKNYPEIENGCLVINADHDLDIKNGEKIFSLDNILSVDNDFFRVFTIPFVSGNPEAPFSNINSAVITESTSKLILEMNHRSEKIYRSSASLQQ
ncbi:MAG: ABC transporter permease [Bacteroidales bacterium]|nr:ABC transporter permease [Bacteroidales bacterium]